MTTTSRGPANQTIAANSIGELRYRVVDGFHPKLAVARARMTDNSDDTSLGNKSSEIDTFSGQFQRRADLRPALVFLRGELLAVQIPLDREQVTLGRALDADIRVNDPRASRLHARINCERNEETGETRYRLSDLDSTNGTMLNGKRIESGFLIDGDKF